MIPAGKEESSDESIKFSEARIAFVLKQEEDGTPIGICRKKAGISDSRFYTIGAISTRV